MSLLVSNSIEKVAVGAILHEYRGDSRFFLIVNKCIYVLNDMRVIKRFQGISFLVDFVGILTAINRLLSRSSNLEHELENFSL